MKGSLLEGGRHGPKGEMEIEVSLKGILDKHSFTL